MHIKLLMKLNTKLNTNKAHNICMYRHMDVNGGRGGSYAKAQSLLVVTKVPLEKGLR